MVFLWGCCCCCLYLGTSSSANQNPSVKALEVPKWNCQCTRVKFTNFTWSQWENNAVTETGEKVQISSARRLKTQMVNTKRNLKSKMALSCEKWLAFRDVCWHMFSLYSWRKKRKFKGVKGVIGFVLLILCWTLCCHGFRGAVWLLLVVCIGFFIFKVLNYCPGWDSQMLDFTKRFLRAFSVYGFSSVPSSFLRVIFKCCYFP